MHITTAIGIGDILYLKSSLDAIRNDHQEIKIYPATGLIKWSQRNADYATFTNDLCKLLFSELPYQLVETGPEFKSMEEVFADHRMSVIKPTLPQLCSGESLNIEPYLAITTKVRYFPKRDLKPLWKALNDLPYKIVILGEREVEMNHEYRNDNRNGPTVYSIYEEIRASISADKLFDHTIPSLGITSPKLDQFQLDRLIMSEAKCMITLGIGGNFTTGMAVSKKLIGFRPGFEYYADAIFASSEEVGNSYVTKSWDQFLNKVKQI
jgi:hypothetical protein